MQNGCSPSKYRFVAVAALLLLLVWHFARFIKVSIASLPPKQAVDVDFAPDSAIDSTLRLTTPDSATYALPSTDQQRLIDFIFPKKV